MKRRTFLKTLAATTAAAALPQLLRAQTADPKLQTLNSKLNIGLIGAGDQGMSILGNALADSRARIVAVCDVDSTHLAAARNRVEKFYAAETTAGTYRGCATYVDYRELLARPDIDAVLVATPEHWHALNVIHAARAGKHIYCEKPAAPSIHETRAMLDAIASAGVVCQTGSQQRSAREFLRAIDLTHGGYLGTLKRIRVGLPGGLSKRPEVMPPGAPEPIPPELDYERWTGPAEMLPYCKARVHYNWRSNFAYAGGRLTDWISHHYDIALLATGLNTTMPVAIRNATATFINDNALYNTASDFSFESHFANGTIIEVATNNPGGVTIEGTEGSLSVNRGRITCSTPALNRVEIPAQKTIVTKSLRGGHMGDFIECALTGAVTRSPMQDAHHVMTAANLANAAFRAGRKEVSFDANTEQPINAPDVAGYLLRPYRAPWTL